MALRQKVVNLNLVPSFLLIIRTPHILHMNLRTGIIIHAFAFLHLAVALGCRLADINDEIMLTLLSVLMVTLLCVKMNARMEIIVSSIILTNVAGYVLGVYGARLVGLLCGSALLTHSVSTFMTTEVIGWCTFLLLKASARWKIPARTGTVPPHRKNHQKAYLSFIRSHSVDHSDTCGHLPAFFQRS